MIQFISLTEIIDMIVTITFVGFIFSDMFPKKTVAYDIYKIKQGFDWDSFRFAAMVTGPALIFHELSHKFVAMSFGMQATYQAAYPWLIFGLILKLMNFGFIVIVPAFVSISGYGTALQYAAIALAGPLMNLLLWLGLAYALQRKLIKKQHHQLAFFAKEINKFLFIFNMLPIPGFDGFQFYIRIFEALTGTHVGF